MQIYFNFKSFVVVVGWKWRERIKLFTAFASCLTFFFSLKRTFCEQGEVLRLFVVWKAYEGENLLCKKKILIFNFHLKIHLSFVKLSTIFFSGFE